MYMAPFLRFMWSPGYTFYHSEDIQQFQSPKQGDTPAQGRSLCGQGSVFCLLLPLAPPKSSAAPILLLAEFQKVGDRIRGTLGDMDQRARRGFRRGSLLRVPLILPRKRVRACDCAVELWPDHTEPFCTVACTMKGPAETSRVTVQSSL